MPISFLPLSQKLKRKIDKYSLEKQFKKQVTLLSENPKHPSLNLELLEPKTHGIYSFRINLKFRALFIFHNDINSFEVLNITVHYR